MEPKKRGRPPKVRPVEVEKPILEPVEPVETTSEIDPKEMSLYKEVMFRSLTEDVGIPTALASELTDTYKRLSELAKAFREGLELPIKDEYALERLRILLRTH